MKKNLLKKIWLIVAIINFAVIPLHLSAQQLFTVCQGGLSQEMVTQLITQAKSSEITTLTFTKNNENKNVFRIPLSVVENTTIVILNEQNGAYVVITPTEKAINEFQLVPFFIEELKQGVLGDASQYLVFETTADFSVRNISAVDVPNEAVFIPRYFYGNIDNMMEATPKERKVISIFKAKPQFIPAFPNDLESLAYLAQKEEELSYYTYMFMFPDGTICTYDEHFNPVDDTDASVTAGGVQFKITGNLDASQKAATEFALQKWGEQLQGTIQVDVNVVFKPLTGTALGLSYPTQTFLNTETYTYYPSALWNQIKGYDASIKLNDIKLEFNTNVSWYLGTNGNTPFSQYDYVTVMLHEANHGLGFSCNVQENGKYVYCTDDGNCWTGSLSYPNTFSRQLFQGVSGTTCMTDLNESQRAALIISNNLYAGKPGGKLLAANGGNRVKMFAPNPYMPGSSVSHWDSGESFTTFMKYQIANGQSCHTINARELGILVDMGWLENTVSGDCPGVTGMKVSFQEDCGKAVISWNDVKQGSKGTILKESFETVSIPNFPTGWKLNTTPGDYDLSWVTLKASDEGLTAQDGSNVAIKWYSEGVAAPHDAWLFSSGVALTAAKTYTITFWLQGEGWGTAKEKLEVKIGTSANAGGMTTSLYNNTNVDMEWTKISKTFTPSSSGTYYLGFHAYSDFDANYMMIDDIQITDDGGTVSDNKFNVYRDGTKIASNINTTSYTDNGFNKNQTHTWTVKLICSSGKESFPATVTKTACSLGVGENEMSSISIYPNPTTGEVTIESSTFKVQSVEIFDIFGRKQKSRKAEMQNGEGTMVMDISNLSNGIYFVKIHTEKGTVIQKVIKQ